ncbi:7-carboxy-7-deazaguanine synthase QueE [Alicyclobacillus vulcanalis]|uniref:7-carboxy-7-deazaguanine synthase n=1 Tax=Alicyclobacillus vulcanalis TaxID=252246 RepID=A0A1N7KWW3_9BACL|nr:radical SAM protein [Alicyclobacillus vulcanalis]SIS66085.1 7-carboxy-7-deazaguanine synthase [Alicyclobacillus vulcanalis]
MSFARAPWEAAYEEAKRGDPGAITLPMVEIFETVEGEGTKAGLPTTFVRVFHCNLRCTWCDTPYSYAPERPAFEASLKQIAERVESFGWANVCLTGGEPLIHRHKSQLLIDTLAGIAGVEDVHIETNGAIDVRPFVQYRDASARLRQVVRFIVDYKLPGSGEEHRMVPDHLSALSERDEVKFVIADDRDFARALEVLQAHPTRATVLFSPVWETMPPRDLVSLMLKHRLRGVKLNLQLHKVIWDPSARGV